MTSTLAASLWRSTEVWLPTDGGQLELHTVVNSDEPVGTRRAPGDGIVGRAVESGLPVLEKQPETGRRFVALPAMRGGVCSGVSVLGCDDADGRQGAVEVWRPNERGELGLADSWCANLERFGRISQFVKFPRRAGLPGKVWSDRFPRVMGALGSSPDFVRGAGAKAEGLSTAVGVPLMRSSLELDAVLVLLSASRSPLARVAEVWAIDHQHTGPKGGHQPKGDSHADGPAVELKIVSADYGPYVDLAPLARRRRLKLGEGIAGRVFREQAPCLTTDLLGVEFPCGEKYAEYGFEWGWGYPVFRGAELVAAVVLIR